MHSYVHCSIISNSQDMEITIVSIDGWIDKEDGVGWVWVCVGVCVCVCVCVYAMGY